MKDVPPRVPRPKTFFLNEQHELVHGEKPGGGRTPQYVQIDWTEKGKKISQSLQTVSKELSKSPDPLRDKRYFVLARPYVTLKKKSASKAIPSGVKEQETAFSKTDSQVFGRLGMDLIRVNADGSATIHAKPESMKQLTTSSQALSGATAIDRARWATIDSFALVPWELKIDKDWLEAQKPQPIDAVIELQPLLMRTEVDQVIRAVGERLKRSGGEGFKTTGIDFSGRHWFRGAITPGNLREISSSFFSVQSVHPPLASAVAHANPARRDSPIFVTSTQEDDPGRLPSVGVVDTGVPAAHATLARYSRGQYFVENGTNMPVGPHGSMVASRVVFGDPTYDDYTAGRLKAGCRFFDVVAARDAETIEDKSIVPAIRNVTTIAPDVRVFNLSFDYKRPWSVIPPIERAEYMALVQDLDNLAYASDILVVVAAGNSEPGLVPGRAYPNHYEQPEWALGPWARSFNALTCGSYIDRLDANGLVRTMGWPSPFSKLGPGLADSPKPDFSAHGGNGNAVYRYEAGLGVWGYTDAGMFEDHSGTSYAAPLLAREAAFTFAQLQEVCAPGTKPYAVAVKAFLCLTAERTTHDKPVEALSKVALGYGKASAERLSKPLAGSAVFLWQGELNDPDDVAKIQIPIPRQWLRTATKPTLKLVLSWDTPVNSAVFDTWACRKVEAQLRPKQDAEALHGSHGHRSYPLSTKRFDLAKAKPADVDSDSWLLEVSYKTTGAYAAGLEFSPKQRVAFAAELIDFGETRVSPQTSIQALEIAATMTRLSVQAVPVRNPVLIRTRA